MRSSPSWGPLRKRAKCHSKHLRAPAGPRTEGSGSENLFAMRPEPSVRSDVTVQERLGFARALVFRVVSTYWEEQPTAPGHRWPLRVLPSDIELVPVPLELRDLAQSIGISAAQNRTGRSRGQLRRAPRGLPGGRCIMAGTGWHPGRDSGPWSQGTFPGNALSTMDPGAGIERDWDG